MVCNKVQGKLVYSNKQLDFIELEWFERDKQGLVKKTVGGEEITLSCGATLNERDIVFEDKVRLIAVRLLPAKVMSVRVSDIAEAGRVCHILGSPGLPVSIQDEWIKAPFDEKAQKYISESGSYTQTADEVFDDFVLPIP